MPISTTITPIELNGKYYVTVDLGGEISRYGSYADIDVAEAAARRIAGVYQAMFRSGVVVAPMPARPAARRRA